MVEVALEQRVARLEGRVEGFGGRFDALDSRMEGFERRMDRIERRLDALDAKVSTQFRWIVGIQVATLMTIMGSFAAAIFALT